jgi:hypothetical protein
MNFWLHCIIFVNAWKHYGNRCKCEITGNFIILRPLPCPGTTNIFVTLLKFPNLSREFLLSPTYQHSLFFYLHDFPSGTNQHLQGFLALLRYQKALYQRAKMNTAFLTKKLRQSIFHTVCTFTLQPFSCIKTLI